MLFYHVKQVLQFSSFPFYFTSCFIVTSHKCISFPFFVYLHFLNTFFYVIIDEKNLSKCSPLQALMYTFIN